MRFNENSHVGQDELNNPRKLAGPSERRRHPGAWARFRPKTVRSAPWPRILFHVDSVERHTPVRQGWSGCAPDVGRPQLVLDVGDVPDSVARTLGLQTDEALVDPGGSIDTEPN
jgi:hypothetical protein